MHIRFDQGTLLFGDVPPGFDLGAIERVRFDDRIDRWRARACDKHAILAGLASKGIEVADDAWRPLPEPGPGVVGELRGYQEDALAAWRSAHDRGVIVLPTGAGKTRIALAAIARSQLRTLILVPTRVLMEQWVAELARVGFDSIGRYGDGHKDLGGVTVATIDAAWLNMHRIGDAFELIIVDEVHRIAGETRSETLEMCVARARMGLTATMPDAHGTARIQELVGPVVHTSKIDELADYLSPFDIVVLGVDLTRAERATYDSHMSVWRAWADEVQLAQGELEMQELVKLARKSPEGRVALDAMHKAQAVLHYPAQKRVIVAELLAEHAERRVLVFTPDNRTAFAIAKQHLVPPITCDVSRQERARMLALFREGSVRCLVSSQVLNEGVDVPDADIAIVVGGRRGEREHVQRIGRVIRPSEGKRATVYELVVNKSSEVRAGHRRRRTSLAGVRAP